MTTHTYWTSIGRNVGTEPMGRTDWRHFKRATEQVILNRGGGILASVKGRSTWNDEEEETVLYLFDIRAHEVPTLREGLASLARAYRQDAIGLVGGPGESLVHAAPRDDLAAEYEEEEYEQERESLSSGHFSTDLQLEDAVSFLEHNLPAIFAEFLEAFPEWETRTMGDGHSSWFDVETMGVDAEWSSWAVDWVENHSPVWWEDGEPWVRGDQ